MTLLESISLRFKWRPHQQTFPYRDYHKRNNCVFIHIPKVAGTSVLQALGAANVSRDHLPWYVYKSANAAYFNNAFKFAFVRNPWDRALSAYSYLKRGGNGEPDAKISARINEFSGFSDFVVNGLGAGEFRCSRMFIPQSEFIADGLGRIVVDYLGRYESINEDFSAVAKKIGIKQELPMANSSNATFGSYRDAYQCDDAINVIREIYRQDIFLLDYEY